MSGKTFQASIPGLALIAALVFALGLIVGVTITGSWESVSAGDLVASVVALLALLSTFYFSWSQRLHNRLQVKPNLIVKSNFTGKAYQGYFSFFIKIHNYGFGPATVTGKTVSFDGKQIAQADEYKEWRAFVPLHVPQAAGGYFVSESANPGEVIDRGQTVAFLAFHFKPNGLDFMDARDQIVELARKISIRIHYEDQYGAPFESEYRRVDS